MEISYLINVRVNILDMNVECVYFYVMSLCVTYHVHVLSRVVYIQVFAVH